MLVFTIIFGQIARLMAWYHFLPDWRILVLPVFVLLAFFASVGPALWITALNVKYRDFRYVIPFIVQSVFTSRRLGSVQMWCPNNGACCSRSIRWWRACTTVIRCPTA
jgi:hypothetical protein